jgi:DNA-binding response OmpR family regulator
MVPSARLWVVHSRREVRSALSADLTANGFEVERAATVPTDFPNGQAAVLVARWKPALERLMALTRGQPLRVLALVEKSTHLASAARHASDFMLVPFHPLELRERVRRLLDQLEAITSAPAEAQHDAPLEIRSLEIGPLRLDQAAARVWLKQEELNLTRREFDLLSAMMARPGQVISRDHLLSIVWGERFGGKARTVDQHIAQLRALLDDDVTRPRFIATRRGRGYVFLAGQHSMTNT